MRLRYYNIGAITTEDFRNRKHLEAERRKLRSAQERKRMRKEFLRRQNNRRAARRKEKEEKKNDDDRFVSCVNCEFSWTTDERDKIKDEFRLRDINFHVAKGELVGIIGRVGSGKSSLLLSILKSTHKIRGTLSVNMKSSIAYVVYPLSFDTQTIDTTQSNTGTYLKYPSFLAVQFFRTLFSIVP